MQRDDSPRLANGGNNAAGCFPPPPFYSSRTLLLLLLLRYNVLFFSENNQRKRKTRPYETLRPGRRRHHLRPPTTATAVDLLVVCNEKIVCFLAAEKGEQSQRLEKAQTSAVNLLRARPLVFFASAICHVGRLRILHSRSITPPSSSPFLPSLGTYIGGIYVLHAQDIDTRNYRCAARPLMLISAEAVT